ncbi:hypothetical protein [Yunchengibacter salinarum]|uniref:hypothetical protein n=1 Tax=Yunchengibacter salinarum TaxID=3133399 RepID=UPI0035B60A8E
MSDESAPAPKGQSAFGKRFEVDTSKPLPAFDTPGGRAYAVTDAENRERALYALVHNPRIAMRNDLFKPLSDRPVAGLVCPQARGLVNLNLDKGIQRLVTVFERPMGGALMDQDGKPHPRMNGAFLRKTVVPSVLKAIASLHKRKIYHRSIHPQRIFLQSDDSDDVVLGECYSAAPGYRHPIALEALELAFADEEARGEGTMESDFYQFGAALKCLYAGQPLWQGRQKQNVLMSRVNQGSFYSLGSGRDVPGAMGNLIKGLMADEPEERWRAEDVLDWFEGLSTSRKASLTNWSMNRPTNFRDTSFVDRRLLADAFGQDPKRAAKFLRTIGFSSWVQTTMRDEILTERMEGSLSVQPADGVTEVQGRAEDYRMVARVCMFLHPGGPIRYKGVSIYLDALPTALNAAFANNDRDRVSIIGEIMDSRFLSTMMEVIRGRDSRFSTQATQLRRVEAWVKNQELGRGMERVMYELSPMLPCMSGKLENVWVASLKQMMRAFDRMAERGAGKNLLLDRHIAAFMAAHGDGLDREFNKIAAAKNDPSRFSIQATQFLGDMQSRLGIEELPNLTEKMVEGLGPFVRNLKNKQRREEVSQALEKVKSEGNIARLTSALNLSKIQAEDTREFSSIQHSVWKMEQEKTKLSQPSKPDDPDALEKGYRYSRTAAFLILVATGVFVFL